MKSSVIKISLFGTLLITINKIIIKKEPNKIRISKSYIHQSTTVKVRFLKTILTVKLKQPDDIFIFVN